MKQLSTVIFLIDVSCRCMIKISRGAGVVTPSKPPPSPYEQLFPLPIPCFKMFLERSFNDLPPPHFKHLSLLPPSPSTTPPPLKILIVHQCALPLMCQYVIARARRRLLSLSFAQHCSNVDEI